MTTREAKSIAVYRADALRLEAIIKEKDAALSGMKAENVKLSQEIEKLVSSCQQLTSELSQQQDINSEQHKEIEKLKQDLRNYAINVCPDKDREIEEGYKTIAELKETITKDYIPRSVIESQLHTEETSLAWHQVGHAAKVLRGILAAKETKRQGGDKR